MSAITKTDLMVLFMVLPPLEERAVKPVPQDVEDDLGRSHLPLVERYPETEIEHDVLTFVESDLDLRHDAVADVCVAGELAAGSQPQPLLRIYEMELLQSAGFGLQLDHEHGTSDGIRLDAWYLYVPESGPKRREYDAGKPHELISGAALLALKSGTIEDQYLKELKTLMRRLIRYYLGDKPLNSQSLFY